MDNLLLEMQGPARQQLPPVHLCSCQPGEMVSTQLVLPYLRDSRCSVGERCEPPVACNHDERQDCDGDVRSLAELRTDGGPQAGFDASDRYGEVDRLHDDKVEDGAGDERRGKVRRQIVVQELLAAHEIEWEVVERPCAEEEQRVSVQPVPDTCATSALKTLQDPCKLTILDRLETTTSGERVGANDADKDAERDGADPPVEQVTNHVDLLVGIPICPEADAAQAERPLDRLAGVRVRGGEARVMLQHEDLELDKLLDEAAFPDLLDFGLVRSVSEVVARAVGDDVVDVPVRRPVWWFLLPLTSCCPKAHSGSVEAYVHIRTRVGMCISRKWPESDFHGSPSCASMICTWNMVSFRLSSSSGLTVVNSWFVAIKGDATSCVSNSVSVLICRSWMISLWRTTRPRPVSGISFVGRICQWLFVSLCG